MTNHDASPLNQRIIGIEEMRSCMLQAIPSAHQEAELQRGVARVLGQRGLISEVDQYDPHLPSELWQLYHDALTSLMTEGVIGPGSNSNNAWWPHFSLTQYGRQCVAENALLPHDPAGFVNALGPQMAVDDVEKRFVAQALEAQRANLPDASAVMLGCAAEHLILQLAQQLVQTDPNDAKTAKLIRTGPAKTLLDQVRRRLDPNSGGRQLPRQLEERRDTMFSAVADVIRVARNDSGHPTTSIPVSRDYCFVLLRMYREYRGWIAEAMKHL